MAAIYLDIFQELDGFRFMLATRPQVDSSEKLFRYEHFDIEYDKTKATCSLLNRGEVVWFLTEEQTQSLWGITVKTFYIDFKEVITTLNQ